MYYKLTEFKSFNTFDNRVLLTGDFLLTAYIFITFVCPVECTNSNLFFFNNSTNRHNYTHSHNSSINLVKKKIQVTHFLDEERGISLFGRFFVNYH